MGIILSIIVVAILLYWIFPFESLFFYLLHLYCKFKIEKYIKEIPFDIPDGTVVKDFGDSVYLKYKSGGYIEQTVLKDCYFNTKGRYIKVKGKRVYI